MRRHTGSVAALIFAIAAFAGPSSGSAARAPAATHKLHVDLTEWALVPSGGLVSSGPLQLTVANYGRLVHELDIIRTSWWGQELGVRHGRAVGEAAVQPVVVRPGQTRSAQVYLPPGSYVLLDNIRGHYALGAAVPVIAS